ncbi:uncharacterized protein (DUF1800 family) [Micromonospora pisi]|uniref:Uncharacterized protein (DUF1800 family) n=1 Tax=Micromonospora pisi TaxID=589240 RepID=A0A495JC60_9ACTN|nr:DUF1800 domain-containing protein [Micromonospora pisi]RKR86311.1 uncharacterized protein (DUF1800 family) [Micromonospora pisi]
MASPDAIAHLLRRATFGPTADEVDAAVRAGFDATLDRLLEPVGTDPGASASPTPKLGPDPYSTIGKSASREQRQEANKRRTEQVRQLQQWWLERMVTAEHQLTEKLVFFWHGHWATSVQKVKSAPLMLGQLDTLRRYGRGGFDALVAAMVRDPAMILWLDGEKNTRKAPNENLARELMELFTLGIGHYTEPDVKAGAKALTGWAVDRATGVARLEPKRHDTDPKTILGRTDTFDADSYARLLAAQPQAAEFVRNRLWARFAGTDTPPTGGSGSVGAGPDITAMLRAVLTDPAFARSRGQLVKQPVEWAVGAMRQLGIRPSALSEQQRKQVQSGLSGMDQVLLRPPSVGGWPAGTAWLTTSSLQARMRLADLLATAAGPVAGQRLGAAPEAGRVDALARLLVVDRWTERTRAALAPLAAKPDRLIAAGLVSPEYTVS